MVLANRRKHAIAAEIGVRKLSKYKLLGNMGSQYGSNFQGGSGGKGFPDFDIDTAKYKEGWMCTFYKGATKLTNTKYHKTEKEAGEEIIQLIVALPSDQRPTDLNTIIWNSVQYRDFDTNTNNSNGLGFGGTSYAHCDHDPDEVTTEGKFLKNSPFSIDKVSIIGATKSKISPISKKRKKRLIVNCSGSAISSILYAPKPVEKPFSTVPKQFEGFFVQDYAWKMPDSKPKLFYGDEVVVDWPDHGAAPLHPRFWVDLLALIKSEDFQSKYGDVVFCCFGGHGRTGTALASLAIVAGIYAAKGVTFKSDPKRLPTESEKAEVWIQHDYCKKAIESDEQTEYLACVEEYVTALRAKMEAEEVKIG